MKKVLLLVIICICGFYSFSQAPHLPVKGTLSETLLSNKSFTNGTAEDTVVKLHNIPSSYTLELVGRVNAATGRGLDMEARNALLKGYRLSLDAATLKWTAPLASSTALTASDAGQDQTIRIAVKGDTAHIYQNGAYLVSQPLAAIKDISNGVETDNLYNASKGPNLIPNWAGTPPNNTGKPSDYGWILNPASSTLFSTANSTTVGTSRYMDVNASSGSNLHTYNGSTYVGRLLYLRWDGSYSSMVYSYPVTLEANVTYDFSMLYAYISNGSPNSNITVGIGTTTAASGRIATKTFTTSSARTLKKDDFYFTAPTAGTYYLTFTGPTALYSIGELSINRLDANPRFIIGKNYRSGAVDMHVSSVTYEDGAYAPASLVSGPVQTVTVTDKVVSYLTRFNTHFVVPGKSDVHFTAENTPYVNGSIALNSNDAWLFFDNLRPSTVLSDWLSTITINGMPAVNNTNVRIAVYKNGAVVIPNGNLTNNEALEVFTQPTLAGSSQTYPIHTIFNNLGAFDNAIHSFKLKRGYMVTFANNANGSGYSRVFIANDSDLVVNEMPQGLDGTISFIRVMKWNWPSKKGKAGWDPNKIEATWYYDWNISGNNSHPNYEYQGIRQTNGWPAYTDIINKGVNHISGFNEPDRPDQSDLTVDEAFNAWSGMYSTGLRVGSPSPANPESSWITQFLAKCDSANYRVDYVTIHCYWGGQTPAQWASRLKAIYNRVKRPLWITEWNNGANWTTESWPSDVASQQQKQLNDLKGILYVLDTASFVERYAEYDWVENKRALVLADTLTPAGKYYAANKSDFAYDPKMAFVHNWKLVGPPLSGAINSDDYFKATLSFKDMNGEMGSKYVLERKISGVDTDFVPITDFTGYTVNGNISYVDSVYDKATYRLKAFNIAGDQFAYGRSLDVFRDAAPVAPSSLSGFPLSSSIDSVKWNAGTNARSYNLKRSFSATGPFETIASRTTQLNIEDDSLQPATTYYYVVTSLNSAGESANSEVLEIRTKDLVAPSLVKNPHVASGDTKSIVTWDFQYDAKYDVTRSETADGLFETIATDVDGTRYEDVNRVNGKTYYYKVVAQNAAGRSPETNVLSATPLSSHHLFMSFDENSEAFAEDVWGGYQGTLQPTASWTAGHINGAVKLDGTSSSYVSLAKGPVRDLNDFTIATWVKMDAISTWMRIFDFGTGTSSYMFLTPQSGTSGGKSNIRFAVKNGSTEQQLNYLYAWPLNTWTHLAITKSGSSANLYINGDLVATNGGFTIKPSELGVTNKNYVGKSQFSDPMLKGSVDEFKVYNRALNADEVLDAMKQEQTISFVPLSQKQMGDADFDAGATASSNLPVSYSSSNTSVATVVNGFLHMVGAGTTTITASQNGDAAYAAAIPISRELTVVQLEQAITFQTLADRKVGDDDFDPLATSSASLPITYSSSDLSVATITSDGKIHIVGGGTAIITASQNGNAVYKAAPLVTQPLHVFIPPMVKAKNVEVAVDENGKAVLHPSQVDDGSLSCNGALHLEVDQATFTCANIGTPISITLTGTDEKGYSHSATATVTVVDKLKPVLTTPSKQFFCFSGDTYQIPALQVLDNCGVSSIIYSVTGATVRSGSGEDASGTFKAGTSIITWTVTDVHGNTATSTLTVDINPLLQATIPDVYAMNPAVDEKNTLYSGYGPSSFLLTASSVGGSAPYNYKWSTGQETQSISVNAAGSYTVTITDSKGCTTSASIVVQVLDVKCGNNDDKVTVCHNGTVICIASAAVQMHLNHGDRLGSCQSVTVAQGNASQKETTHIEGVAKVRIYPNPVTDQLYVTLPASGKEATFLLYNSSGALVLSKVLTNGTSAVSLKGLPDGVYYAQVWSGQQNWTEKIVKH